ncbi:MAG: hypothetical protein RR471_10890 [Bacteroides sp.]
MPAHRSTADGKLPSFIAFFLPEDCKVKTSADFYYVTAITCLCATFIFPPCVLAAVYCVVKAKRQKGGNQ